MEEKPSKRRLFIAVEIEESQKREIARTIEELKELAPKAKFVRAEKLHLTLQFLGYVEEERVAAIEAAMDRAVKGHPAHSLQLQNGGAFGGKKSPRVLWIGVGGELETLGAIQKSLSNELELLGFEPEHRKFAPHLTLARAKEFRGDRHLTKAAEALSGKDFGPTRIHRLVLMESVRTKADNDYVVIHESSLKG